MGKSRKKFAVPNDTPKGTWKQEYNGKFRSKSKQLLKQVVEGDLDPDELVLPENLTEVSEIACSSKEQQGIWNFELQESFLNEKEKERYLERLSYYEKSFRK